MPTICAGPCGAHAGDADPLLTFSDLELGDPGLLYEVDQLLQLAQIHAQPPEGIIERELEGELVAASAEPADHADRDIAEIGVMAEGLAGKDIGQVNLDEGKSHRRQGVTQRNTRVRERSRIDDREVDSGT